MTHLKDKELESISGGDSYTSGPIISAVIKIIELVRDAGYDLGSGFRRMSEDQICPLK